MVIDLFRRRLRGGLGIATLLGMFSGSVMAQSPPSLPGGGTALQPGAKNLVAEAARLAGIRQCIPGISRLASQAIEGSIGHDLLMDRQSKDPDASAFFSLIGVQLPDSAFATSIVAIPERDGSCTLMAERIVSAPSTCAEVAKVELQGYRRTALLPHFNVYSSPQDIGSTISLLDAGSTCTVIRRYVKFGWRP